jgi:hypothetical protein
VEFLKPASRNQQNLLSRLSFRYSKNRSDWQRTPDLCPSGLIIDKNINFVRYIKMKKKKFNEKIEEVWGI